MAAISLKQVPQGRAGDVEAGKNASVRRYTATFLAKTDNEYDDSDSVIYDCKAFGIYIGSPYPYTIGATCRKISAEQAHGKTVWRITVSYSDEREWNENPLLDPAQITWNSERYEKVFHRDRNGKAILNAVGDYFDPPVKGDATRWSVSITKNVIGVPLALNAWRDSVNSAAITIDGYPIGVNTAKMADISIGGWQTRNGIYYRVFTFSLHLKDSGWTEVILNQGMNSKITTGFGVIKSRCIDGAGQPVSEPVLLNDDGTQNFDPTPDNATYIESDIYRAMPFAALIRYTI